MVLLIPPKEVPENQFFTLEAHVVIEDFVEVYAVLILSLNPVTTLFANVAKEEEFTPPKELSVNQLFTLEAQVVTLFFTVA